MDALKSFFRTYNAVRADDHGPQFHTADDSTLLAWCDGQVAAWDKSPPEIQSEILPILKDLRRETFTRLDKYEWPDERKRLLNRAWYQICLRIGFGN